MTVPDGDTPLATDVVDEEFFSPSVARERFTARAGRLLANNAGVDETAAREAVAASLDGVRERLVAGTLVAGDEPIRDILEATKRVIYTPETETWTVVFHGEDFDK